MEVTIGMIARDLLLPGLLNKILLFSMPKKKSGAPWEEKMQNTASSNDHGSLTR